MLRIGVLVSGGGTNLQALMDYMELHQVKAEIVTVVSNRKNAYALARAEVKSIPTQVISPRDFSESYAFNEALMNHFNQYKVNLVVMAGYLVVIGDPFVSAYKNKIINIHPSLIPAFCGDGYYGLKVHEAALKKGVKLTGATVHFVDEGTDTGPIIMQKAVEVRNSDTPKSIQERVMTEAEWVILPKVVEKIANNKIRVEDNQVIVD
ncbi:phosphoribosylglycinamide formyltransferase [Vallitalea okinawensis]|uniref:phosphoribosylglycinamide formyltransferase n=1 Tax=Vallitalea okinawensis TaxID=2078660 RepID=UPI000CFDC234|nr:phosphoribosylglycinamide formyltransferase [Vallitalea okinawensis]